MCFYISRCWRQKEFTYFKNLHVKEVSQRYDYFQFIQSKCESCSHNFRFSDLHSQIIAFFRWQRWLKREKLWFRLHSSLLSIRFEFKWDLLCVPQVHRQRIQPSLAHSSWSKKRNFYQVDEFDENSGTRLPILLFVSVSQTLPCLTQVLWKSNVFKLVKGFRSSSWRILIESSLLNSFSRNWYKCFKRICFNFSGYVANKTLDCCCFSNILIWWLVCLPYKCLDRIDWNHQPCSEKSWETWIFRPQIFHFRANAKLSCGSEETKVVIVRLSCNFFINKIFFFEWFLIIGSGRAASLHLMQIFWAKQQKRYFRKLVQLSLWLHVVLCRNPSKWFFPQQKLGFW